MSSHLKNTKVIVCLVGCLLLILTACGGGNSDKGDNPNDVGGGNTGGTPGGGEPGGGNNTSQLPGINMQLAFDFNDTPTGYSSNISERPVQLSGWMYFSADDGQSGQELWRFNGTVAELVADIRPGEAAGRPFNLLTLDEYLYFSADDGVNGRELWRSNGNLTEMVFDLNEGGDGSPEFISVFNGWLYFYANRDSTDIELWRTNATGTERVIQISDVDYNPNLVTAQYNGQLYFTAGSRLWRTDGNTTEMFSQTPTGNDVFLSADPNSMLEYNGMLYFSASSFSIDYELFRTDGNTIELVMEINNSIFGSDPSDFTLYNGELYFVANDGSTGYEIWRTDSITTQRVTDISPPGFNFELPLHLTVFGGQLYFTAVDGVTGRELWRTNGSTTEQAADIAAGVNYSHPEHFILYDSSLYFAASGGNGTELWRTNGTVTEQVMDIYPGGSFPSNSSSPNHFTVFDGTLYFTAQNGVNGSELWRSNGTITELALDLNTAVGTRRALFESFKVLDDTLYFVNTRNTIGRNTSELWRVDGQTPVRVNNIHSNLTDITLFNSQIYFVLYSDLGDELWRTTAEGMEIVADINTGTGNSSPDKFITFNNALYFSAVGEHGRRVLWRFNGTLPEEILSVEGSEAYNDPENMFILNGHIYFAASSASNGYELWRTDGTTAELVEDINPGSGGSGETNGRGPFGFTPFNGFLYFAANDGTHGLELWRTNGTTTEMVQDIYTGLPGSLDSNEFIPVAVGSWLYFVTFTPDYGLEVWRTNGTTTEIAADLHPGPNHSYPQNLTLMNGQLFFTAVTNYDDQHRIIRIDDTTIEPLPNINLGNRSHNEIEYLYAFNNQLFFVARTQLLDTELWRTNGNVTERVTNFVTNSSLVEIGEFITVGNRLYITVDDGIHGMELWHLENS